MPSRESGVYPSRRASRRSTPLRPPPPCAGKLPPAPRRLTWTCLPSREESQQIALQETKHPGAITALAFGPDGRYLAIAGTEVRDWRKARKALPWDLVEKPIPTLVGDTVVR